VDLTGAFTLWGSWGTVQATATYNWIFPIDAWKWAGSWNWYAGIGAGLGYHWDWYNRVFLAETYNNGYGIAGVAGMIGVEYNFKFPLQLSLEWRPLIGVAFSNNSIFYDKNGWHKMEYYKPGLYHNAFALGVRYKF
jgi:hypothetical protein